MEPHESQRQDAPDELVQRALAFFEQWALPVRLTDLRVEYSFRMTASLARTYPRKALIRLSSLLMREHQDLLSQVICHEAAHLAVYWKYGSNARPHGPEWARLVTAAGCSPARRLLVLTSQSRQTDQQGRAIYAIYLHRCLVCHSIRKSKRRIPNWRCETCLNAGLSGEIVIEKIAS